ncbi:MAG: glycosyltransferase [Nitrososphaerales archaeon]
MKSPKVTVIFPARNVETTIKACIEAAKRSEYKPSIIVSDGYSTDKTRDIANECGVTVVTQHKKLHPGKGNSMVTGIKTALENNSDVIVFLDADIKNLTPEWVDKLVKVVLEGRSDMARGSYERRPRDAPVTKLIARPMLAVFFPELGHLEQPLSGEVCAKREVWESLLKKNPPDGWGIDIWFLIESTMLGYNISEVFLGKKEHGSFAEYMEDVAKLSKMAEQVGFTIIREAIRYDRITREGSVRI